MCQWPGPIWNLGAGIFEMCPLPAYRLPPHRDSNVQLGLRTTGLKEESFRALRKEEDSALTLLDHRERSRHLRFTTRS